MTNKTTSLHSMFSVDGEASNDDTRFLNITIDVMHTGENLNGSFFSKEDVDACVDSIKNTPVLGFIKYDALSNENDYKGHEHIITKTENGIEEKYIGRAYGVIPESCNPRWITKTTDDGQEREFLQVDALMWEKFDDATNILRRDSEKGQSMEISVSSVDGFYDEDGLFHFKNWKFDGCCILGDDVDPAMVGANVAIKEVQFAFSDFAESIKEELNDKFTTFSKLMDEKSEQGGVIDMTKTDTDFAQTVLSQFEDISAIVAGHDTVINRWGEARPRFSAVDVQDDEVIVVDGKEGYNYYGFKFTVDGDKPVIDFAACKRKKVRYEDYEDGAAAPEGAFDFGKHIGDVEDEAASKVADAEQAKVEAEEKAETVANQYEELKSEYDEIKPKYDEYVAAEEQRKADELNAQKDAKFAEYEEILADNEEFAALKAGKGEMSVDEIEKECAVLYVRATRGKHSFSKNDASSATIGLIEDSDEDTGFVHTKYGNIAVGR